jgi:hypothetical protein
MGYVMPFSELPKIIIKDIHLIERYTFEQVYYSFIYFEISDDIDVKLMSDILAKSSRKSDLVFVHGNKFVLLLAGVDKNGVKHISNELRSFCKDLKDLIYFTYPVDIDKEELIIDKLIKIINEPIEKLYWSKEIIEEMKNKTEELIFPKDINLKKLDSNL